MENTQLREWLQKNARYLASFDLNQDKKIDANEIGWALKTVEAWRQKIRLSDQGWKLHTGSQIDSDLSWAEIGLSCATAPMRFIGRKEDSYWLPFCALLRAERPDLPESFEAEIPVHLSTLESTGGSKQLGLVSAQWLCSGQAIADVVGAFSAPKPELMTAYAMELAIAQRIAEQSLRRAAAHLGGRFVCGVQRELLPIGKSLQVSLLGTAMV